MTGPTKGDWALIGASDREYRETVIRVAAAWFVTGTMKEAAELMGLREQTVKNVLYRARQEARVNTNTELVQQYWEAIGRLKAFGLNHRKMRYHFDEEYRERAKKQARTGMRKKREATTTEVTQHYDRLLTTQGNVCAICRRPAGSRKGTDGKAIRLAVDHDHTTGAIRELLCSGCNLMIGCAKDDPDRLEEGARYLRKHAEATSHKSRGEAA